MGCRSSKVAENKHPSFQVAKDHKTLPSEKVTANKPKPAGYEDFSVLASETPCE